MKNYAIYFHLLYLVFFLCWSNNSSSTAPTQLDELLHENKGCPINSFCSKTAGEKRLNFEKLIKQLNANSNIDALRKFHKEHGLPIQFLTTQKAKQSMDPILWSSRCDFHNPRNPNQNIFRAEKFFKVFPKSDQVILTPINVYTGNKKITYHIPYGDQVSFIKNDQLILLKDYDDFYYQIAVNTNGSFEVVNHSLTLTNMALERKIPDIKCPEEMSIDKNYFSKTYCSKMLDIDTNDLKIVQYAWSCP